MDSSLETQRFAEKIPLVARLLMDFDPFFFSAPILSSSPAPSSPFLNEVGFLGSVHLAGCSLSVFSQPANLSRAPAKVLPEGSPELPPNLAAAALGQGNGWNFLPWLPSVRRVWTCPRACPRAHPRAGSAASHPLGWVLGHGRAPGAARNPQDEPPVPGMMLW